MPGNRVKEGKWENDCRGIQGCSIHRECRVPRSRPVSRAKGKFESVRGAHILALLSLLFSKSGSKILARKMRPTE